MKNYNFWLKFGALNFLLVVVLGLVMRLNFVFAIPFLNQKFLLEAHSHFAFYGWITQAVYFFSGKLVTEKFQQPFGDYNKILIVNAIASYGMLISFLSDGYFWLSITFSSLALFTGFVYCWLIFRDTKNLSFPEIIWLKAGAFFAVVSAVGIFGIAFSAHKRTLESLFRASTYFYLHYQYNGFFIFSCIALFISRYDFFISRSAKSNHIAFWLLFSGCLLGYGLSVLWMELPGFIKLILFLISILQILGALILLRMFQQYPEFYFPQKSVVKIFTIVFLLKFLLQVISCIPAFKPFIFGDRSAVIAYLHLVLLSGITVFLFWVIISILPKIKKITWFFKSFIASICFNQLLLFAQCFSNYFHISTVDFTKMLIVASIFILFSGFFITFLLFKNKFKYI